MAKKENATQYKIGKLEDFLKIPSERLGDCLKGFEKTINSAKVIAAKAQAEGKTVELHFDELIWVDDGEDDVVITNVNNIYAPEAKVVH